MLAKAVGQSTLSRLTFRFREQARSHIQGLRCMSLFHCAFWPLLWEAGGSNNWQGGGFAGHIAATWAQVWAGSGLAMRKLV